MGKGKKSSSAQAVSGTGQKKKGIVKTNSFGTFAAGKAEKKGKIFANVSKKDLMIATMSAEKKGNRFSDGILNEKRKKVTVSGGGRLETTLMKGAMKKKSRFDLDSDGENEDMPLRLTHQGKKLEDLDDYKDRIDHGSSGDEQNVPAEIVDRLNFTGFEGGAAAGAAEAAADAASQNPDRKKSKKEVYEEIIKKSKKMKYERQNQHEEDSKILKSLNDGYSEIAGLLKFNANAKWDRKTGVADEFDRLARELQGDSTTQANTVMKKVEDKKQKKLQEKRRKQMKGIMSSDGEDEKDLNNDDELTSNTKRELSIVKHLRKVQNLNKFVDQIKSVKDQAKKVKMAKAGIEEEDDEEYDSLDEIDLDGEEDDGEDEDERLDLEDEFESDEEPKDKSKKKSKKQQQESEEEEDDGEEEEDDGDDEEEDDEEEEAGSDEFENESD